MKNLIYIPIIGSAIFIGLYLYTALIYPGGSNAFLDAIGSMKLFN